MSTTASRLPTSVCVVILRNDAVLAVSRRDDHSQYGFPGGKLEPGESPEAGAVRETKEETGLDVDMTALQHLYDGKVKDRLVRTFLAPDPGGDVVQSPEGVVVWVGWHSLVTGPFAAYNAAVRQALGTLPEFWAREWGSGTLRRAIEENMAWRELYLEERTALEVGYGFIPAMRSRLTVGRAMACGEDPGTTETCWWARALRWRADHNDRPAKVDVVHARLDNDGVREGLAIRYTPETRPAWLPSDRDLIAFTTLSGKTVNPC